MASESARVAAYADLVTALLDIRPNLASAQFDAELSAAQAVGGIDEDTARRLRWWQRESVREVVDHAQSVLPPTLIALSGSFENASLAANPTDTYQAMPVDTSEPLTTYEDESAGHTELGIETSADESDDELPPPADLGARRLLVAGLTPLRQP